MPQETFFQLRDLRQRVWFGFASDAALRPSKATPQAELKTMLETPIDPHDWLANGAELYLWRDALRDLGAVRWLAGRERSNVGEKWNRWLQCRSTRG